MQIEGDYNRDGYAVARELITPDMARAFMAMLKEDLPGPLAPSQGEVLPVLKRHTTEIYGGDYPPMLALLWGLTGTVELIIGQKLVPTYSYFRFYREGDVLRVHSDRPACEHSVSLTLDYSDNVPWPIEVARQPVAQALPITDDFGAEPYASVAMQVGDALVYRGTTHRHARITPNPNGWSAHIFMHWVDPSGPHADQAFDGVGTPRPVNFSFG
jgi:hypothetical protein